MNTSGAPNQGGILNVGGNNAPALDVDAQKRAAEVFADAPNFGQTVAFAVIFSLSLLFLIFIIVTFVKVKAAHKNDKVVRSKNGYRSLIAPIVLSILFLLSIIATWAIFSFREPSIQTAYSVWISSLIVWILIGIVFASTISSSGCKSKEECQNETGRPTRMAFASLSGIVVLAIIAVSAAGVGVLQTTVQRAIVAAM